MSKNKSLFMLHLTEEERKSIKLEAVKQDKTMQELIKECIMTSKKISINDK